MNPHATKAALLLGPLFLALGFSLARIAAEPFHVPEDADYVAAREVLRTNHFDAQTDAWVVLPPWSLRAWKFLGDYRPISGDALYRRPLHRFTRLFVITEPDADEHLDPLLKRLGAPAVDVQAGRVHVLRFDLGPQRMTYDFRQHIQEAEVRIVLPQGEPVVCQTPAPGGKSAAPTAWPA